MSVSICSAHRLAMLETLAERGLRKMPGSVAEVGVYKGGSAKLLAGLFPHKPVHLFDTFNGMPDVTCEYDNFHKAGDFSDTTLEAVQKHLNGCPNVVFHIGVFPDTAAELDPKERFVMVHVDCDLYRSVRACCELFFPRLQPNGVIVFDDYHHESCLGAKKAVDEFFVNRPGLLIRNNDCCYVRKQ